MPDALSERDVFNALYVFGGVTGVKLVRTSTCAFVEFATPEMAANALSHVSRELTVNGYRLSVSWASRPKEKRPREEALGEAPMPAPPGMEGAPVSAYSLEGASVSSDGVYNDVRPEGKRSRGSIGRPSYPSMDPSRLGSVT